MPDTVPDWFDRVRSPLVILDSAAHSVLALNAEAHHLFGLAGAGDCVPLAVLVGEGPAAAVAAMSVAPPERPVFTACRVLGRTRTLGLGLSTLPGGQYLLTLIDQLTEHEAADQLSAIQNDIREIMEALPVGVEIFDDAGNNLFVNSHGAELFGYGADEALTLEEWWPKAYPDPAYRELAIKAWINGVRDSRATLDHVHMVDWLVTCKDGSQKMIHFRVRSLGGSIILVYWDVSDQRRLLNKLRQLADTDELTGLANRRRFLAEAQTMVKSAREASSSVALLMIDLDFFKTVNDRFGHPVGDLMLREIADKCRRALRGQDLLARFGGEEFVALLPGTGASEALRVAERLRSFIAAAPMLIDGHVLQATVSIGFAVHGPGMGTPPPPESKEGDAVACLMRRADAALYVAKRAGRNRVEQEQAHREADPAEAGAPPPSGKRLPQEE
ncbi:sensor domain-containing diguanylate cyclase [Ancylobacter sp. 6x-1]|uniref:diguanylate cyclase n=1 Tax=Ancylobacter crimeensis TaxID=2579147 RepID=A0ABT0DE37_9HYPH|nr:sensor domain-containing diguanylate cyclase [Ancylobacter crimeensis]MCK0198221.1 sensor domain-containing diguanylate cyclase [Ancylobacter crimeensis]